MNKKAAACESEKDKRDSQKAKETKKSEKSKGCESEKAEETKENGEKDDGPSLEEQLKDADEQYKRLLADFQNYKTRVAREKEQSFSNAKCVVISEFLKTADNLERALGQGASDYESLKKGVEMTLNDFTAALEKLGVHSFGEPGESFDPNYHNAVGHTEDENLGENVITEVYQKGYKTDSKVIRTAMVITAN